jgi:ABC-type bacteriocin/lantibiotic exporter with double-glycine peptidase domain
MFGLGGIIKAVVYLVIVVVIAGGLWYAINLKADLAVSEANNQKLQDAVSVQKDLIESMQRDITQIQETNKQLAEQNEKQKQDVATLSSKFSKRDFGALAAEKPAVVEKLVNRGTANVMRCLELASGAPLNEKEINAKTPTEANRECPSLINPSYTAPN